MITGAVAFDPGQEPFRVIRMPDRQIDLVTGDADLEIQLVPFRSQPLADFDLEVAVRFVGYALYNGAAPCFCVFKITF
jgi:hypothetical protein